MLIKNYKKKKLMFPASTYNLYYAQYILTDASPRLNPLLHKPRECQRDNFIAYHSLTSFKCVLEISWL